ncbi:MAG TPA: ATP-binding cassette domain-containing protein [Conexibacter sp.]|nr:ATP-binding cassette domain-containing protein [Conexibacter sp.]
MLSLALEAQVGAVALDVELDVPAGGCLALAGPSGAGKTSVLRAVAGLLRPARGHVVCGGETWLDTAAGVDLAPERRRCGYVFQDYALFGHLSAWRNVAYGLRGGGVRDRSRRRADALALLARFGVERLADARPATLSGGERQRVALARALAARPRALLLDEPLAALDARSAAAAARELAGLLRALEVPALLVTHDFEQAALLGDEVAVLDAGRIVQRGTAAELAAAPASSFVADLTGAVVLRGRASPGADGLTRVALDGGGEVLAPAAASGEVAVSVHPWEIALEPLGTPAAGSARNRLEVEVVSVTEIGNRVRVGLAAPQPLAAELTGGSVARLGLAPGTRAVATWKAAATRVMPR